MATVTNGKDEDEDLRRALQAEPVSTSAAHDEIVLRAARDMAHRSPRRFGAPRWIAMAAVLVLVFMGTLWRGLQPGTAPRATTETNLVVETVLAPGLTRGRAALPRISIGPGVATVQLHLQVPPDLDTNNTIVSLNTRVGKAVWQSSVSHGRPVSAQGVWTVQLPANVLAPAEYELSVRYLSGSSDSRAEYYYFEVSHE